MDTKIVDTAIAQAKADIDKMQVDGMMVVDALSMMRAVLMRLPTPTAPAPAAPVAPLAPPSAG